WWCIAVTILAVAQLGAAKPPAFSDLTPARAAASAAESGRAVVVVRHDRDSLASEIMRTRVWTDPAVERWISENAIGVWIEYDGRASLRFRWNAFVSVEREGRSVGSAEVFMGSECLLGWLTSPRDIPIWQTLPRAEWRAAEAELARLMDPTIETGSDARLLGVWRSLPDLIDDGWFRAGVEPWDLPLVAATRRIVQERPSVGEALAGLADELERGLADRNDAVDRWRWLLIVSGVFGDDARAVGWLERELATPDRFSEGVMLARYTEPILERAGRWDLLIRSMDMDEQTVGVREHRQRILQLRSSLDRLAHDARIDHGEPFARIMRHELRLHLGSLAIDDGGTAQSQLDEMRRVLVDRPYAVQWLIGSAANSGLLHSIHLDFLDPDNPEHAGWIEQINSREDR
ncbi:MAG: hypothetical protein EA380_00185, partial [Phycisphaeraceae bacterium]